MTPFDRQRISSWVSEAFAILCVRAAGGSSGEENVRLGFEAILRSLGTSPLRIIARSVPPPGRLAPVSTADWRQIVHALDRCRTIFARYDTSLTAVERHAFEVVERTRGSAHEELLAHSRRRSHVVAAAAASAPERPVVHARGAVESAAEVHAV